MKRLSGVVFFLFLAAGGAAGESSFSWGGQMNFAGSIYQGWLNPSIEANWMLIDWAGIGVEGELFYGTTFGDMYMSEILRGWLGPFYLGLGTSTKLMDASPADGYSDFAYGDTEGTVSGRTFVPMAAMGFRFDMVNTDKMTLGFNTGMDYILTDVPIHIGEDQNLMEAIISGIFQAVLGSTLGGVKFGFGASAQF